MGSYQSEKKMKLVAGFLALAQASCPSDSCWNFNSTTNACTLDTDAGCVELTCQSTGMAIDFSADLFGSGGDGLWLGDIEPSAGGKGFQISANFGDVGSTYELTDDLFIQKIWLAKTGEQRARSSVGHNVIDLGGANDVYTTPFGVGIMFSCEYSRSVTISSDFDVNTVTSFGTKESSGIGNLAGGFSMDLSGAENDGRFIMGSEMHVGINWAVTLPDVSYSITDCTVTHGDISVDIVDGGCYAQTVNAASTGSNSFIWTVFKGVDQDGVQQSISCTIELCKYCAAPTSCPVNDAMNFQLP